MKPGWVTFPANAAGNLLIAIWASHIVAVREIDPLTCELVSDKSHIGTVHGNAPDIVNVLDAAVTAQYAEEDERERRVGR